MTSFTNNASLTGTNGISEQFPDTVNVEREKLLTKGNGFNYNNVNQTVDWKVQYNYGEKHIDAAEAVIHDRFTDAMILVGDVKVTDKITGTPLLKDVDYKLDLIVGEGGKNGYDLTFLSPAGIDSAYDIEYTTKAVDRIYENVSVTNDVYTILKGTNVDITASHTFSRNIGVKDITSTNYANK
ncbi:hypothetical protein D3C78_1074010 [compost metagenome]